MQPVQQLPVPRAMQPCHVLQPQPLMLPQHAALLSSSSSRCQQPLQRWPPLPQLRARAQHPQPQHLRPLQAYSLPQHRQQQHAQQQPSALPHNFGRQAAALCESSSSRTRSRQQRLVQTAAAASASGAAPEQPPPSDGLHAAVSRAAGALAGTASDLQELAGRFLSLWRSFLPMLSLFFCLSFVNTILDSLKDTLVITAYGGGAFVIPYLTVYAVLPLSMVFLVAFSAASQRMPRASLFNAIVAVFMAFFALFGLFLYPNADALHPHALADQLQQALPQGLAGLVGMVRNWTFTLFFCMSELWGDVCMGLLFWGLANEITNLSDAATLYPLFGLGANLAQALAGMVLKATTTGGAAEFGRALQLSMAAVIGIAGTAIMLQQHITNKAAEAAAAARRRHHAHRHNSSSPGPGASASSSSAAESSAAAAEQPDDKLAAPRVSLLASFKLLAASLEIRCLAIMSLGQGLCNSLMEFAWKCHMRLLYPSPADFTAFLGDVATWSGVVTGGLMLLSPLLFERLGWRGVASTTPTILLFGGSAFFAACIAYQHVYGAAVAAHGAAAAGPMGVALLQCLVGFGALLYVFGKGAKFSLFKPAEEMVYITLDEEGRSRGKAAIDVVGAQTGKSGGSLLQQALLLLSAGSITGIMPVMFAVFFLMLRGWRSAVHTLSTVRHYSYDSPTSSMDEEDGRAGSGGSTNEPALQQQLQQLQQAANGASGSSSSGSDSAMEQLAVLSSIAAAATHDPATPTSSRGSSAYQAALGRSTSSSNGASGDAAGDADDAAHAAAPADTDGFVTVDQDAARSFRQSVRSMPPAAAAAVDPGAGASSSGGGDGGASGTGHDAAAGPPSAPDRPATGGQ